MIKEKIKKFLIPKLGNSKKIYNFAKSIISFYDNDCNPDIQTNGELNILKKLISSKYFERLNIENKEIIFFDVGAHQGHYTKAILDIYKKKKFKIFCFDLSKKNLDKIQGFNCKSIKLFDVAISNKNGDSFYYQSRSSNGEGASTDSLFDMQQIGYVNDYTKKEIKTFTLDYFHKILNLKKINFLKIDIEGNELNALIGAKNLLQNKLIDFIQFEFGHASRASRVYLFDIINYLEKYDFIIFAIKPNKIERLIYDPFTENKYNMANFFACHKSLLENLKNLVKD